MHAATYLHAWTNHPVTCNGCVLNTPVVLAVHLCIFVVCYQLTQAEDSPLADSIATTRQHNTSTAVFCTSQQDN